MGDLGLPPLVIVSLWPHHLVQLCCAMDNLRKT